MKVFALSLFVLASAVCSQASVLVSWTTEGLTAGESVQATLEPATVSPYLREGALLMRHVNGLKGLNAPAAQNGVANMMIANRWRADGTAGVPAAPSSRQDAIDDERYFTFSITPQEGYMLSLSSLSFEIKRQLNGAPTEFQWAYIIGDASEPVFLGADSWTLTGSDAVVFTLSLEGVEALQNVQEQLSFRLYGWGTTVRAAWAGFSTEHGDSLVLNGAVSVIPEPEPIAILLLGGCVLFGAVRRLSMACQ